MQLVIDSRESRLLQDLECDKEFLALGDIVFRDPPYEVVVERKTWGDLWSSVQDGRYREQRSRLIEWSSTSDETAVLYLIEGSAHKIPEDALETCRRVLLRLQIAYRISVVYTSSAEETVEWVRWFREKEHLKVFFTRRDSQEQRVENIQNRLPSKKSSIQNPKTMLITFLRAISGVSYAVAAAVAEPFTSLQDMVNHREELLTLLPTLEYTTPSQKTKRVGPKMAEKIAVLLGC